VNPRQKGKVGEREFAALLRENGFDARRGCQFSGSPDSPDVLCAALRWLHIEVKRVQNLNLTDACVQAQGDCGGKPWIVAHRRNHCPWLITMRAETFFEFIRGTLPPEASTSPRPSDSRFSQALGSVEPWPSANSFRSFPSCSSPRSGEGEKISGLTGASPDKAHESCALPGKTETKTSE
jgi:hypothetical protein